MTHLRSRLALSLLASSFAVAPLLTGCATVGVASDDGTPASSQADDGDDDELTREIVRGELELAMAQAELESTQRQQALDLKHARMDVELAEGELAKFLEVSMPGQIASGELSLRGIQDRATEAAEELRQIELMYEDQDLDDMTAEFVVARGRRGAERAAARIAIEEAEFAALRERDLPMERTRLEMALEKARAAVTNMELEHEHAIKRERMELEDKERELAEKREKADK